MHILNIIFIIIVILLIGTFSQSIISYDVGEKLYSTPTRNHFQIVSTDRDAVAPNQTTSRKTVVGRYQLCADLTLMFERYGLDAWVIGPTLLGAIRHGGLEPSHPVLYFGAFTRDQPAWGAIVQSNALIQYGYEFIQEPTNVDFKRRYVRIYMSADPNVEAYIFWVQSSIPDRVCPTACEFNGSQDEPCQIPLEFVSVNVPDRHRIHLGNVADIEPRRSSPFGATRVMIPNQAHQMLDKQEGTKWQIWGRKNNAIPAIVLSKDSPFVPNDLESLPWYNVPYKLQKEDRLPALPIGPLRPADRGESFDSRNDPYRSA